MGFDFCCHGTGTTKRVLQVSCAEGWAQIRSPQHQHWHSPENTRLWIRPGEGKEKLKRERIRRCQQGAG